MVPRSSDAQCPDFGAQQVKRVVQMWRSGDAAGFSIDVGQRVRDCPYRRFKRCTPSVGQPHRILLCSEVEHFMQSIQASAREHGSDAPAYARWTPVL